MGNLMKRSSKNQPDQSMVQQPVQYRPPGVPMQQQPPGFPMQQQQAPVISMQQQQMGPRYGPPLGQMPPGYGQQYPNVSPMPSSNENDAYFASVAGISPTDVGQLRMEFYQYANLNGIIDRDGFRKLYVASLLNKTWDTVEREAETAFRTFDINQTGGLDFNEYMMACARMLRGHTQPPMYSQPSMYPY